ncbi:MAG: hypothetical protein JST41_06100 [Bacteroidetes bacterium]|nr:hypothetical protein [Bacteroidota bacterium]MBX7128198.1 hypothetical protein [Flavobacteriales bacterium]MCC6656481.1 hypothetical protein [Flavobacteriales bacterium]HMU14360.1 hypothetical protein [Flavobacteriales bacterium]HMZ48569.1 hypothetical protein [Flavobacteriales bacterium]
MAEFEYGIGGTERPVDASEAFADLPQNKTLMIEKLTADGAAKPQIATGLTNVEAVFEHFKPKVEMEFEGEDGATVKEDLKFKNLGDFGSKGLTRQSGFLQGLNLKQNEMNKIVKQLRSNKRFVTAMQDPAAKAAFVEVLKGLAAEIDAADKH